MFVDHKLISSLLECNTEHFLVLHRSRNVIRVDLDHVIIAFFLGF